MRLSQALLVGLALAFPASLRADGPKDPLRFLPAQVDAVAKIERPRGLLEAVEKHELVKQALSIGVVREFYDSTNFRRFYQLITFFERELGKDRHALLDGLAGGGVVVAAKIANSGSAVVIVQSRDERLLQQFVERSLALAEKELSRLEVKEPIKRVTYEGVPAFRFGPVKGAVVDGALVIATDDKMLKSFIDGHLGKQTYQRFTESAVFQDAKKGISATADAWGWLNLETVRGLPDFKAGFEAGAQDPNVTILFGGLIDVFKRAPYVAASLSREKADWQLSVRLPRGRDGMGGISKMVVPQKDAGSLPLLAPPRTFASLSYFMDLGQFWEHRATIFNEKQVAELDKVEKESGKFLGGVKLGQLFNQMGNHHRVVFATPDESPYKVKPAANIPAFALVVDMRDPQFAKSMNFILRGIALLGSFTVANGLKVVDEEHAGRPMVCYYFPENKPYPGDPDGIRFAFSPCFATVGDQLVMSSTVELGRNLIDELQRGTREPAAPATMRTRLYATGAAQALRLGEEQVLTQLILSQALPPGAARDEVRRIIGLVERLGVLGVELDYRPSDLQFLVKWQPGAK